MKVNENIFECVRCALIYASPLSSAVKELTPVVVEKSSTQGRCTISLPLQENEIYDFDTVEIRCIKIDSRGTLIFGEQTWPDNFRLACAGSGYVLTEGTPLKPTLSLKKRKDNCHALNSSTFQKIIEKNTSSASRKIYLDYENVYDDRNSYLKDMGKIYYAICVLGVKKLKFDDLLTCPLVQELNDEESMAYFKTLLSSQQEEVAVAGLKLEVLCKITFTRPEFPVRGNNCQHLSCFSLKSFYLTLSMSEHRKVYCPICQRTIQFYFFDRTVENIIKNAPADVESIVVDNLGNFDFEQRSQLPEKKLLVMEVSESDEDKNEQNVSRKKILSLFEDKQNFPKLVKMVYFELAMMCAREAADDVLKRHLKSLSLDN